MTQVFAEGNEGRAMRVRSPLIKVGDWLTDQFWMAHRSVPLYRALHDYLPARDGQYRLGANGPTRLNDTNNFARLIQILLTGPLLPAVFVEQAPSQTIDLSNANATVAHWEPWYVEHPDSPTGLLVYDGACCFPTTRQMNDCVPVDDWGLLAGLVSQPVLVGLAEGERRFCVTAGVPREAS